MPHAVSISDGSSTISLSTTNVQLNHYTPQAPTWDEENASYQPVIDTIDFLVYESTAAAAQTKIAVIERILLSVQRRAQSRTGPIPYLILQMASDASSWRSEILGVTWVAADDLFQSLPQGYAGFRINIRRVPFWEGARTNIPLTNGSGTNVTTGLLVNNANDYAGIAADVIGGTLPTPLELSIQNVTGAGRMYRNFYASVNPFGTTLTHTIQGETAISGWGVATASANASGGQVARLSTVGASAAPFRWTIPAATTSIMRGRYANIVVRFAQATSGLRVRTRIYDRLGFIVMHESPDTAIGGDAANGGQHNCGAFPIPGGAYDTTFGDVTLEVTVYTTGTTTIDVDYITLMPSEPGCFRHFQQQGYTIANNGTIVDNGIVGNIYSSDSARDMAWKQYTEPLYVQPALAQRIYLLIDGESNNVGWQHRLIAYYRPRRLTIGS